MKPIRRDSIAHDSRSRDAALRRLRRANRWLIAGSALLTGLFVDFAANAFSGHTASASAGSPARSRTAHHTSTQPLKPPAQAPKAAEPAPQTSEAPPPAEEAAPEPSTPEASSPARESAPEAAPETHSSEETHEAAPPASETPEPVVSGAS